MSALFHPYLCGRIAAEWLINMTKQEIMKMKNSGEIMSALAQNRDIWDEELSNHLKNIKRKENLENFGEADIIHTPPRQSGA